MKAHFALEPMHANPFNLPDIGGTRPSFLAPEPHQSLGYYGSRGINPAAATASLVVAAGVFASLLYIGGGHHKHHREHHLSVIQLADLQPPPPPPPQAPRKTKPAAETPPEIMAPPPVVVVPSTPSPTVQTAAFVAQTTGSSKIQPQRTAVTAPAPPAPVVGNLSAKLVSATPPTYPIDARRSMEQGTVVLSVVVSEQGSVSDISIFRSSGSERLDHAALRAVRRWRWSPTFRDGSAVLVQGLVKIPFVLQT